MKFDEKIKEQLIIRGFSKEQLLNNRGLIGATINETVVELVKNLTIQNVSNNEVTVCLHPFEKVKKLNNKVYHCEVCDKFI